VFVINSNVKGAVAEQAIVLAATKLLIPVLKPVAEHGRTDLALDIGGALWRVQVKWGRLSPTRDVVVAMLRTSRYTPRGQVFTTYSKDEVDLFAICCGELDRCFLVPAHRLANKTCVSLRLTPERNRQQSCINLADDFTFDGAVAQLARATRWQRVGQGFESPQLHLAGEDKGLPAITGGPPVAVSADAFRQRLGRWIDRVAAGEEVVVTRRGAPVVRAIPAVAIAEAA
jgi:prevent-host-death family protein